MTLSDPRMRDDGPKEPPWKWVGLVVVVGAIGFVLMGDPGALPQETSPSATTSAAGAVSAAPVATPRCVREAGEPFRVGPAENADRGLGGGDPVLLPFSAEVGRGVALRDGFAVGVKRDRDGGTWAEVAVMRDGATKLVGLGRSRGDMDAPMVTAAGDGWVAGLLEPNAGGLALRLVRPDGDEVTYGAELPQGRDESLATDLAVAGDTGVAVWDDVVDDGERAVIRHAVFAPETLALRGSPSELSPEGHDAELPRLVVREGGFWAMWIARARRDEGKAGGEGGRYAAERIDPSWIEVRMLDRDGEPVGESQAVTPRDGHVLAFDAAPSADGERLVIAWKDDDTPSGAHGGTVATMVVDSSGAETQQPVAQDDVGAGVPSLLDGWIAVSDARGRARLAPTDGEGTLQGALQNEDVLASAQLLTGHQDRLLAALPAGRAVELFIVRCDASVGRIAPGAGGAEP